MKTITNIIYAAFALFAFACFALAPLAKAQLSPAPDGGYPGQNTAEGEDALFSLTTGTQNTAIGFQALRNNTTSGANTAIGFRALFSLTTESDTTGYGNTAIGLRALFSNTTGRDNTAIGTNTLFSNTTGEFNTATSQGALGENTTGNNNTASGFQALGSNTTGFENTASGINALLSNTDGWSNTATGSYALYANTSGTRNTATGQGALSNNLTGERNVGTGYVALSALTSGGHNAAFGTCTFCSMTSGEYNTAIGYSAGWNLTTGNNNIVINNVGVATESNTIRIGSQVAAVTADNSTQAAHTATYIAGIYATTVAKSAGVFIDANGRLGTKSSSQRFKDDIKPMDKASEAIHSLKPVTFRYKKEIDAEQTPQFGLVAEDVEKVNPDLVVRDAEGKVYTVRYEAVNAMLLNEFLKEHRKNQEQEAIISQLRATDAQQQKQIEALTAGLQKVSAQLELSEPAPQTVLNNH